jgi:hypothetical protein
LKSHDGHSIGIPLAELSSRADLGRHGIARDRREPGFGKEALGILGQEEEFAQAEFMRPSEQGLKQPASHALVVWGYGCGTNQAH